MVLYILYGKIVIYWIVSFLEKDVFEIWVLLVIKVCWNKIGLILLKIFWMIVL